MTIPFVSVIVPVYGVEQYIAKCGRSLMEQTLQDMDNWGNDPSVCITE